LPPHWYHTGRTLVNGLKHILYGMDVVYHAPLPAGVRLLAANHPSTVDPVLMTTLVPEQVSILISETLFKTPLLGASLRMAGHIRVNHDHGRPAFEEGVRRLRAGRTVGIFPEGAISPADGGLAPLHSGAVRLAMASGAPLIPIGIALQPECVRRVKSVVDGQEVTGTWYFHGGYAITVGEALWFADGGSVQAATALLTERIAALAQESAARLPAAARREYAPLHAV